MDKISNYTPNEWIRFQTTVETSGEQTGALLVVTAPILFQIVTNGPDSNECKGSQSSSLVSSVFFASFPLVSSEVLHLPHPFRVKFSRSGDVSSNFPPGALHTLGFFLYSGGRGARP